MSETAGRRLNFLVSLLLLAVGVLLAVQFDVFGLGSEQREPAAPVASAETPPARAGARPAQAPRIPAEIERLLRRHGKPKYSWKFEELFIREFFRGERDGFFVDVGAYDYKENSNTYFLEDELGWSGIAIEAQERFKYGYLLHRPRTKFFALFVTDHSVGTSSLFIDQGDDKQSTGLQSAAEERREKLHEKKLVEVKMPNITLDDLFEREGVTRIDFLSMDIEQGEPAALRGFDIQRFRPRFVCIEAAVPWVAEYVARYFADARYVRLPTWSDLDRHNEYYAPLEEAAKLAERYAAEGSGPAASPPQ